MIDFLGDNPFMKDSDIIVVIIIIGWNDSAKVASWPRLGPFQRQSPWNAAAYLKPWGALRIRILLWRQRRLGWHGNRKVQRAIWENANSGSRERWLDKIRERLDVCLSCSHVHCTAIASHLQVELDRWPEREQCMLPVICIYAIHL